MKEYFIFMYIMQGMTILLILIITSITVVVIKELFKKRRK